MVKTVNFENLHFCLQKVQFFYVSITNLIDGAINKKVVLSCNLFKI